MIITCPYCRSSKDIGDVTIPKTGATATCQACHRQFELPSGRQPAAETPALDTCPSCNLVLDRRNETDSCPQCGLVFSKYLARFNQITAAPDPSPSATPAPAAPKTAVMKLLGSRYVWCITMVVVLAAWARFGHDWKLDANYRLQPGNWQGEMLFRGKQHPFLLVIQSTAEGNMEGYMDWIESMPRYRLAIRGTHTGNHLKFEDYKFLEGDSAYGLHDHQDVYIVENEMNGTAKNGNATLHAVKVATEPDPIRELQN